MKRASTTTEPSIVKASRAMAIIRATKAPQPPKKKSKRRTVKLKLITRAEIDGRTVVAKQFEAIAAGIAQDLGGADRLSTIQRHLVEGFAGVAVHVHDINARLMLGETIDITEHSQAISTMVRVATRIGINRLPREITSPPPSVSDYVKHIEAAE